MLKIKCGDIVQVKALMAHGEIDLKCKVIEYKNDNGFPKQPTLRAMEHSGRVKKGQVLGGSLSEIVAVLGESKKDQDEG